MGKYMSGQEAAAYLCISVRTLQRYAREKNLSRVRLSRKKVLYIREEIEQLAEAGTYRVADGGVSCASR